MAVVSGTAEGIDPLQMEPSASKSTSELPTTSSSSSLSSAADTPDLTDPSNSSPNPNRDGDIQVLLLQLDVVEFSMCSSLAVGCVFKF